MSTPVVRITHLSSIANSTIAGEGKSSPLDTHSDVEVIGNFSLSIIRKMRYIAMRWGVAARS